MAVSKSDEFIEAYHEKRQSDYAKECQEFNDLVTRLGLIPDRLMAVVEDGIYIKSSYDRKIVLVDERLARYYRPSYPEWVRNCSECSRYTHWASIPLGDRIVELDVLDTDTNIKATIGQFLEIRRKYTVRNFNESWFINLHNTHLSLWEKIFGPDYNRS